MYDLLLSSVILSYWMFVFLPFTSDIIYYETLTLLVTDFAIIDRTIRAKIFYCSTGHLHHRVYVIRVLKAVPKTHQTKCQEVTTASMEEVVYTDPLSAEVKN